jgi:hypothetical protein
MLDICSLPQQHDLLHDAFHSNNPQKNTIVATKNIPKVVEMKEIHNVEIKYAINAIGIGARSNS